ncbi:hypothetical protein V2A60_004168 [Cordyceps javanica]
MVVWAIGLNAVPGIGSIVFGLVTVLSAILFPAPKPVDPWIQVRERIENLVGTRLQEYQVRSIQAKSEGIRRNAEEYSNVMKLYSEAKTPEEKGKYHALIQNYHTGLLILLRSSIPELQTAYYAAITLPLFAQAANLHLSLLAEGINHGLEWGFSDKYVTQVLPDEFRRLNSSGLSARDLSTSQGPADDMTLTLAKTAIDTAEALGVPPGLVLLWKEAYATLVSDFATRTKRDFIDYVSHAKKTYAEGRKQVQPYDHRLVPSLSGLDKGTKEASAMRAYADYDTEMLDSVLKYVEFWPVLDGKANLSESALRSLDREVFFGPYGRWTKSVLWSADAPAAISERRPKMTSIVICAADNVLMLAVRYRDRNWPDDDGQCLKKAHWQEFSLEDDEYIENVDVRYGHKLGQLTFTTNKGKVHGPYGRAKHADLSVSVNRTGYSLSYMRGTRYVYKEPEGLEGISFGFRPLLTAG